MNDAAFSERATGRRNDAGRVHRQVASLGVEGALDVTGTLHRPVPSARRAAGRLVAGQGGTLSRASGEWEQILKRPWSEIRQILLDESDEGQRLRSTHPFRRIVTQEERGALMAPPPPPGPDEAYGPTKIAPEVLDRVRTVMSNDATLTLFGTS